MPIFHSEKPVVGAPCTGPEACTTKQVQETQDVFPLSGFTDTNNSILTK